MVKASPRRSAAKTGAAARRARGMKGEAAKPAATPWYCAFTGSRNAEYEKYMREEWGWEKRGDRPLFEKLSLEGQQAGLSWATILAKRDAYRKAFHGFNVGKCAAMTSEDVDSVLASAKAGPGGRVAVVCNRGKLLSIPHNAQCVRALRSAPYVDPTTGVKYRTLDGLLWSFVRGRPILNTWASTKNIPTVTPTAEAMSRTLRKLGFSYVGPTICYSLMQSCGLVVDHPTSS
eukprot:CAMPEP_0117536262 /NCGR_PEP_ID=MMETSP0784-20121206/41362_1 /TAXON_ID=39447 /ORGANISM="" /LENGTH=231 /DNA_ID=CAMNT_0005332819 /DNA_START=42 /DNA_END=733 /DNA_ORIENTATION=-